MKLNVLTVFLGLSSITYASESLDYAIKEFSSENHEPFVEEPSAPSLRRYPRMDTSSQSVNNELSRLIDLDALPGISQ